MYQYYYIINFKLRNKIMVKKNKFKFIFCLILISLVILFVYLFYTNYLKSKQKTPEEIAEQILNNIVTETQIDLEAFDQKYKPYFTEDAYEQILSQRTFGYFVSLSDQYQSTASLRNMEINPVNNTENSREFFITMLVQFPDADNNYNVKIRFVSENQQWLIDYLTIEEANT